MKILHIVSSINPKNGGVIESIKLKNILYKELKLHCEIACLDCFSKNLLIDKRLPFVNFLGVSKNSISNYINFNRWLIIYSNIVLSFIFGAVCDKLEDLAKVAKKFNVKYSVVVHGMLDPWFNKDKLKYIKKLIYWWLIQYRVLRDAKSVIFTSNEEAKLARKASFFPYKFTKNIHKPFPSF